jgi:hypothetical protein
LCACVSSVLLCVIENDSIRDAITITTNSGIIRKHTRTHCICTNDDNTLADGGLSSNGKFDTHETYTMRERQRKNDRRVNINRL